VQLEAQIATAPRRSRVLVLAIAILVLTACSTSHWVWDGVTRIFGLTAIKSVVDNPPQNDASLRSAQMQAYREMDELFAVLTRQTRSDKDRVGRTARNLIRNHLIRIRAQLEKIAAEEGDTGKWARDLLERLRR
jgi:hypothetical protein